MTSDAELIDQVRNGHNEAFGILVRRHERQVRSTVAGMLGDAASTDDVAQEVFIRFYRSIAQFKGEAQLSTYLSRIAINLSLNELKRRKQKQKRLVAIGREEWPLHIEDQSVDPSRADTRDLIRKALQMLEPEFRSVIVLRLIDGYSVKETARILELPMGTIASRLSRAQDKLKDILKKWNVFE